MPKKTMRNTFDWRPQFGLKLRLRGASCWLALGLAVAIAAGCTSKALPTESSTKTNDSEEVEQKIAVHTRPVELRTIEQTISGLGRCEMLPQHVATLTAAVEGQVRKMSAALGDSVTAGQAIVQLDNRIAQANLTEKLAERDASKAALKLLTSPPRPEELKAQQLAVEQAESALHKAQAAADRLRPLATKEEISTAQMQDAERAVADATLQRQAAEAQLQVLKLGPRLEAISEAQAKIATADALVQSAQAELDARTLRAPIAGILNSLSCEIGQTIAAGTPIGQIVDTKQLMVVIWLPASSSRQVKIGQRAKVSAAMPTRKAVDISPQQTAQHIPGQVVFVGRVVDSQSGNLPVHILVDNSDSTLTAGQTVEASIVVGSKENVLAIPLDGLSDAGNGPVINVIRDGKSTIAHPTLGLRDGKWAEVLGTDLTTPLTAGEPVIVEGGYNLPEGTAVTATNSTAIESATTDSHSEPQDRLK